MRRTIEQALTTLREHVLACARGDVRPGVRVFVYPPEWEAVMLERFRQFERSCAEGGAPIDLVDVGAGFLDRLERDPGGIDNLAQLEQVERSWLLNDLAVLANEYVADVLAREFPEGAVCRLLINTSALATFVSYSAITNELVGDGASVRKAVAGPSVLAFPGEGDDRALNLLHLRADTNYRVPRL